MDAKEKDQKVGTMKMLPETRTASGQEVAIAISIVQANPEADGKIQPPKGSPSNDPAGPQESGPVMHPMLSPGRRKFTHSESPLRSTSENLHSFLKEHSATGGSPGNESITSVKTNSPTPKTPLMAFPKDFEDDYDEEEIYKKVELKKETHRKIRVEVCIEWIAALGILGCFIASFTVKELRKIVIWDLKFWKWCLLLNVIFCGMLVANWFMHIVVFLNRRNFIKRMTGLPFVHRLQKSLQVFIWLGLVLLVWASLFNHGVERTNASKRILDLVTWTLIAALVGSFLWLLKTLLLEILESKFRVDTFFDRIQDSIFNEYVLKTLSGPPLMEMAERVGSPRTPTRNSAGMLIKKKSQGMEDKTVIHIRKLYTMKKEEISGWTMKVLVNHVTSSQPSIISPGLDQSDGEEWGTSDMEISSEWEARAAAYRIFRNVAQPGCKYIEEEDLLRFLTKEEVDVLFPLLDGYETGKIKKSAIRNWVVKVYRDWKALAHTLYDTRRAVTHLNKVMSGILVVVSIIIWLLLMKITTSETIAIFLTAAAFAFGNTFKTIFEAAVFIFGVHPFDVGDCCVVDGIPLVVEEMDILTTVFLKPDNEKIYYPNSVLATKPISNYYRSPDMGESVEFSIAFATPLEKIGVLKARIKNYLESSPRHWHPDHSIVIRETENENKLKMTLHSNHTMNFQDLKEKNRRRSELVIEMRRIFEDLNIKCSMPPDAFPGN